MKWIFIILKVIHSTVLMIQYILSGVLLYSLCVANDFLYVYLNKCRFYIHCTNLILFIWEDTVSIAFGFKYQEAMDIAMCHKFYGVILFAQVTMSLLNISQVWIRARMEGGILLPLRKSNYKKGDEIKTCWNMQNHNNR